MRNACFFCGQSNETLHKASTFDIDERVRKCALVLQDTLLLAKLSAGDMISQDAVYHAKCLVLLYNKASRVQSEDVKNLDDKRLLGIVLAK